MQESKATTEEDKLNTITNCMAKILDKILTSILYSELRSDALQFLNTCLKEIDEFEKSIPSTQHSHITDTNIETTLENIKKLITHSKLIFNMIKKDCDPEMPHNIKIQIVECWKRISINNSIMS